MFLGCVRGVMIVRLTESQDTTFFAEEICQALERRIAGLGVELPGLDLAGTFLRSFQSTDQNSAL